MLYFLSGVAVIVVVLVAGIGLLLSEKRELANLKDQRKEISALKDEFLSLRQRVSLVETKKNMSKVQGIVQAVDDVFSSMGLRDKVKTVKSTGKRETGSGIEEEADVYIEKVNLNETVNIFYRLEHAPMILTIKKAVIKKSFENPELLNLSLDISFVKAK